MQTKTITLIFLAFLAIANFAFAQETWPGQNLGVLACPGTTTASGNTSTAVNDCSLRSSKDHFYQFTLSDPADVVLDLCTGTSWDTYLYLFNISAGSCSGSSIVSNDDACNTQSRITQTNLAAGTYVVLIEGYGSTNSGAYTLTINTSNCATPMSFVSSAVTQTALSPVSVSQTNCQILGLEVVVNGSANPFSLSQLRFNMSGTTLLSDVSNIRLYYTGNTSSFSVANLVGSATSGGGTITIAATQTLMSGTNYFWLSYDITNTAVVNNFVDASIIDYTLTSAGTKIPANSNPAGSRQIIAASTTFVDLLGGAGSTYAWARGAMQDPGDDCYIFVGHSNDPVYSVGGSDALAVKLSPTGDIVWSKWYGGANDDRWNSICPAFGGGYIMVGKSNSFNGSSSNHDVFVAKVSTAGNVVWAKAYDIASTYDEYGSKVIQTSDGNYAIVGTTNSGDRDMLFLKIDPTGAVITSRYYDWGSNTEEGYAITETSTGSFVLAGESSYDFFVVKTTANVDWSMKWGGTGNQRIYGVFENAANDYTIVGTDHNVAEGYAMRFTNSGSATVSWTCGYGGVDDLDFCGVNRASDGGYIAAGILTIGVDDQFYGAKINQGGDIDWNVVMGSGVMNDEGYYASSVADGGYIFAGMAYTAASTANFFMAKVGLIGTVCYPTSNFGARINLATPTFTTTACSQYNATVTTRAAAPVVNSGGTLIQQCIVLPVEMIEFTANPTKDQIVEVEWTTATELNNHYFSLYRSNDCSSWNFVSIVAGAGTSNETHQYFYDDYTPYSPVTYYKLVQTDFDGESNEFGPIAVSFSNNESASAVAIMKSDGTILFALSGFEEDEFAELRILDMNGKMLLDDYVGLEETSCIISSSFATEPGIYQAVFSGTKSQAVCRFLISK